MLHNAKYYSYVQGRVTYISALSASTYNRPIQLAARCPNTALLNSAGKRLPANQKKLNIYVLKKKETNSCLHIFVCVIHGVI
jgi:hypothetical protein